jgi:hypothetical protein
LRHIGNDDPKVRKTFAKLAKAISSSFFSLSDTLSLDDRELSVAPTLQERERAARDKRLEISVDDVAADIRQRVDELAREYEGIRSSMRPSTTRTAAMESVVTKMRAIGLLAYPIRGQLALSDSPG